MTQQPNNPKKEGLKKNKPQHKKQYLRYSSMGVQMIVTLLLSTWAGVSLDEYYTLQTPWFTVGFLLFGVFASMYIMIKKVMNE